MDLYDRAPVALLQHERHVRGARTALIRRDDHAETALSCEFQRLLLLDAELGAEDMHGGALVDWLEDRPRLTHDPVKSEAILARKRGCQDDLGVVPARAPSSAARSGRRRIHRVAASCRRHPIVAGSSLTRAIRSQPQSCPHAKSALRSSSP